MNKNALAKWLLDELESERRWQPLFEGSRDDLARLAQEALEEHREGRTRELALNES